MLPLLLCPLPLPSSVTAGVSAAIALSSLVSSPWWATCFSSPQLTRLFSTARSFYKPWERSHPPRPLAHGTSIMSNPTTSAPLPSGLDLPWPTLGGVLSTWIFNDPARFRKATKINLAFSIRVCVFAAVNRVRSVTQNRRKEGERPVRLSRGMKDALEMITQTLSIH